MSDQKVFPVFSLAEIDIPDTELLPLANKSSVHFRSCHITLGFRDNGEQKCKLQNSQLLFFLLRHKPRNQFNFTLYTHIISPISLLRPFIFTLALEPVLLIPHTSHSIRIVQNSVSNIFSIVWGQSWQSSLG